MVNRIMKNPHHHLLSRNLNLDYEISHTAKNGTFKQLEIIYCWGCGEKETHPLLLGMVFGATLIENSIEIFSNNKNTTSILSSNSTY